jgi:hypothetical protein
MSYKLKKNHLANWDRQPANEKPISHNDRDSYISERSSISSLDETTPLPRLNNHHRSPPIPQKEPHKLVYPYNQLPENGVPLAIQAKQTQKEEEKIRKQNFRKAPPSQGSLAPLPEPKPSEMGDNYYPYWYYYKATNPDWVMRHRQYADGQMVPYNSFDPSQYIHPPAVATPSKKSRRHHEKSNNDSFVLQYNPDKKCYEWVRKDLKQSSPEQYTSLNDVHRDEHSNQPNGITRSHSHGKLKTENDWSNHYIQSTTTNKLLEDSHTSKHPHSKKMRHISPDENNNHQHSSHSLSPHHHHHHRHHHRHHHHDHHHHHQSKEYQVRDTSFKKSERTPFFQPTSDSFPSSPPAIYNQSSYLPPILYDRPNVVDHSSTQTFDNDWKSPPKSPKIHKRDSQTNFYDRYLNNVIIKRIAE